MCFEYINKLAELLLQLAAFPAARSTPSAKKLGVQGDGLRDT